MAAIESSETDGRTFEERTAGQLIGKFVTDVTVPLFLEENSGSFRHLGTGTLFSSRGRHFLITAQHVLEGVDVAKTSVPRRGGKERLRTIGEVGVFRPREPPYDIAIVEFRLPQAVSELSEHNRFLTSENIGRVDAAAPTFLCGYPEVFTRMRAAEAGRLPLVTGRPLTVHSTVLNATPDEVTDPSRGGAEIFCAYARKAISENGEQIDAPELEGVSGCGVWQFKKQDGGVWTGGSQIRLVAVQHAYKHDQYFRALTWAVVHSCFNSLAPDIAAEIADAVSRGA
jgi:hypothetical protein